MRITNIELLINFLTKSSILLYILSHTYASETVTEVFAIFPVKKYQVIRKLIVRIV